MKKYIVPEIEIEKVSSEDIISTSVGGDAGGSVNPLKAPGGLNAVNDGEGGVNVSGNVDMLS